MNLSRVPIEKVKEKIGRFQLCLDGQALGEVRYFFYEGRNYVLLEDIAKCIPALATSRGRYLHNEIKKLRRGPDSLYRLDGIGTFAGFEYGVCRVLKKSRKKLAIPIVAKLARIKDFQNLLDHGKVLAQAGDVYPGSASFFDEDERFSLCGAEADVRTMLDQNGNTLYSAVDLSRMLGDRNCVKAMKCGTVQGKVRYVSLDEMKAHLQKRKNKTPQMLEFLGNGLSRVNVGASPEIRESTEIRTEKKEPRVPEKLSDEQRMKLSKRAIEAAHRSDESSSSVVPPPKKGELFSRLLQLGKVGISSLGKFIEDGDIRIFLYSIGLPMSKRKFETEFLIRLADYFRKAGLDLCKKDDKKK